MDTEVRSGDITENRTPVQRLMSLFEGFDSAYGTHGDTQKRAGAAKQEIKKSAKTLRAPVTQELWEGHVSGAKPIGIIPIRNDSTCKWGCIDVDKYDLSHTEIVKMLADRRLPLAVLKSKSGGAHLVLFMRDAQAAIDVRSVLGAIAASLGFGQSEIFPKQTELLLESGDLGNWLNMPYLGGNDTERYAVKPNGMAMSLEEFVSYAEGLALNEEQFVALASVPPADRARPDRAARSPARKKRTPSSNEGDPDPDAPPLSDGPPCLEHLASAGFGQGMRNNGLFALGVYCQKRYGDDWEAKLEEYNQQFMTPPLPAEEVSGIKRSLSKTEYQYACKQQPLCGHCNQTLCRTRRHGISSNGDYPVITTLSVLDTDPPVWFLDVEDERIEVSTDDLMNYRAFQKLVMERLHKCYRPLKQETWMNMVSQAVQNVTVIEAPQEVSLAGHFKELLTDFLTNRQKGTRIEDIHSGRPWEDENKGRHYFRLRDLAAFLEREGMRNLTRGQITTRIRNLGGNPDFKNIKGKGVNLFYVPTESVEGPVSVGAADIEKDPM